jgi:hypothetical protein
MMITGGGPRANYWRESGCPSVLLLGVLVVFYAEQIAF